MLNHHSRLKPYCLFELNHITNKSSVTFLYRMSFLTSKWCLWGWEQVSGLQPFMAVAV